MHIYSVNYIQTFKMNVQWFMYTCIADIHLRVSLCELIQDMVNSAALWFIQQSHHLAYPHNKHPTWNLTTLTIEIKNIRYMYIKPLETV